MKTNFRLFILIFIYLLFFRPLIIRLDAEQELIFPDLEVTISMDFQDASLKDVIKIFSIQSGLNFIASEAVQDRKITLYLDKVPVKDAMDKLFKANNLTYELDADSNVFIVKEWGKPEIETITKVFFLKYSLLPNSKLRKELEGKLGIEAKGSILDSLKEIISDKGKITEDPKTNSLIITDIPSRFPRIEEVIAKLDVSVPQVLIEVEMLDVSKNTVDALGFDFSNNPITLIIPGGIARTGPHLFIGDYTRRGKNMFDAIGVGGTVSLGRTFANVLDFLRTQTDTKYLARPRILTLNNETAEIGIETDESIGVTTISVSTTGEVTATPERKKTGVSLRVTPQVNIETGEITMFIYPKVADATVGNTLTSGGRTYIFRDPEERSTKSIVRVKDGDTIILGGLIRNEFTQEIKKIPILGDIPIIGVLFRHKSKTRDKERELLVFITPHIIKDTATKPAEIKKVLIPEREQALGLTFNRQKIINATLDSFERMR